MDTPENVDSAPVRRKPGRPPVYKPAPVVEADTPQDQDKPISWVQGANGLEPSDGTRT